MPSVHAVVDVPWGDGSTLHMAGFGLPWRDGATVHAAPSGYTPGEPPEGGTPTAPTAPMMLRIDARPTYNVVHEATVVDLRDEALLDVFDVSMSIDEDSVFWTLRGSGPGALYAKLMGGEQPAQVEVTIDGIAWRYAIDSVSRSREFGVSTAAFTGRSLSVVASAPYQSDSNWVNDEVTTAAQMAAIANIYTGLEVIWLLDDWLIPEKIFTYAGTPLGVVRRIAEAVGAVVTSDRVGARVTVSPRYPVLPNEWAVSAPNVQLPFEVVQSEVFERVDRPEYDGVYVSGQQGGTVGFVRLEGTGGAVLHPLVTELLLTEEPALYQRGAAILGASGGQARVTLVLPVLAGEGEPGVLEINHLVRVLDPDGTWYGLVRAVSVSASGVQRDPRVRQTVILERHTKAVPGTVLEPPSDVTEWWVGGAGDQVGDPYYFYSDSVSAAEVEIRSMAVRRDGDGGEAVTVTASPSLSPPRSVMWEPAGGSPVAFAPVGGNTSVWGLPGAGEAPTLERVSDGVWRVTVGNWVYTPGLFEDFGVLRVFGDDPRYELAVSFYTSTDSYEFPRINVSQTYLW